MEGPTESKFLMGQFSRIFYWIRSFLGKVFGGIFFSLKSVFFFKEQFEFVLSLDLAL